MSAAGLESIDHTVQLTHQWINELDARLGWGNRPRSFRLLRSVLQALRDWLPVNEAAAFGAQLPILLRGVYYEHWRPAHTPVKERTKADFLERIDAAFEADPIDFTPDAITQVFELFCGKMGGGEVEHVRHALPSSLRMLWPEPPAAD